MRIKTQPLKDYHDSHSNHCPNRIALCPAEVGALTPMFEKSAIELKLKQKLLKCKSTIQIVTFNVRTLNRIGQLSELTASPTDLNIDIICMEEHRYVHCEVIKYHDTGNGWAFVSASAWKNSDNAAIGVGVIIGPRGLKITE